MNTPYEHISIQATEHATDTAASSTASRVDNLTTTTTTTTTTTSASTSTSTSTNTSRQAAQALRAIFSLANQHDHNLAVFVALGAPATVARTMLVGPTYPPTHTQPTTHLPTPVDGQTMLTNLTN